MDSGPGGAAHRWHYRDHRGARWDGPRDHTRYHSAEDLKERGLWHLRDAAALLESKATPEERDDYRRFVVALADRVAAAHKEHGQDVSPAEAAAIQEITAALSPAGS